MSSFLNGNNNKYFKDFIDKEKLIAKILINIESKLKIIEDYKIKYFNYNNQQDTILMNKFDFIDLMNEFEETITQSSQGLRSLIVELKNLKEKKEIEDNILKRNSEIKNKTYELLNNFDYRSNNFSQNLDEFNNINNNNITNLVNKGKNRSFSQGKELDIYSNLYGTYNNGSKNKLNLNKIRNNSSKNIPTTSIKKKLNNNNIINTNNELDNKNPNFNGEEIPKLNNNYYNQYNQYKSNNPIKKIITNNQLIEEEKYPNDLSIMNELAKEYRNNSLNNINKNYNKRNNYEDKINNRIYRKILRLQIKEKNKNLNKKKNKYKNNDKLERQIKNNSFSQKYELELQNTNQEGKNEKIEVEIKLPLRQGLRQNFKKNLKNDNYNSMTNRDNYYKNRDEIIERINSNEKLKIYFAKKYGGNRFDLFLNKFYNNRLNLEDIKNELNIMSVVIKKEEENEKNKEQDNNLNFGVKPYDDKYEFKFLSHTPMQNIITKRPINGNSSYKTITPYKYYDTKNFNQINNLNLDKLNFS